MSRHSRKFKKGVIDKGGSSFDDKIGWARHCRKFNYVVNVVLGEGGSSPMTIYCDSTECEN